MARKSKPRGPALFVRMTDREMKEIEKASQKAGFHTVSEFVRVTMKKVIASDEFSLR